MMRNELLRIMRVAYGLLIENERQCPRAASAAIILDLKLDPIAAGRNLLPLTELTPCTCDCGADTLVEAGRTCKAVHAEMDALAYLKANNTLGNERYMVTTRPPCKNCLQELCKTNTVAIVTTDQYPDRDASQEEWPGIWITLPYEECKSCNAES